MKHFRWPAVFALSCGLLLAGYGAGNAAGPMGNYDVYKAALVGEDGTDPVYADDMGMAVLEPGRAPARVIHFCVGLPDWGQRTMVIDDGEHVTYTKTGGLRSGNHYLADIDGDGGQEIVLLTDVNGNGSAAEVKCAEIYKVRDGMPEALLATQFFWDSQTPEFDTGYSIKPEDGFRYHVTNRYTGEDLVYRDTENSFPFQEDGTPREDWPSDQVIGWSSPDWFEPIDYDGDGVDEINCVECFRFIDDFGMVKGGYGATILKYHADGGWRVLKSKYIPMIEHRKAADREGWDRADELMRKEWYRE